MAVPEGVGSNPALDGKNQGGSWLPPAAEVGDADDNDVAKRLSELDLRPRRFVFWGGGFRPDASNLGID